VKEGQLLTFLQRNRSRIMFALAIVGPLLIALALVPSRGEFAGAAAALVFVVAIVAFSVGGNRFVGFVASISSVIWYDFYLTKPYDRLTISHRPDIETAICLLIVGVVVSELAARSRHLSRVSTEEAEYVDMVRNLTELANGTAPSSVVIERAVPSIMQLLDLRDCRFERAPSDPPMARIMSNGEVTHVGLDWPVNQMGIPGPEAEIVAQWRGRDLGRFVITPTPGEPISRERRVVAALLVSVVGAAIATRVA
jgi:K+-sensing histidine kinase KdpD